MKRYIVITLLAVACLVTLVLVVLGVLLATLDINDYKEKIAEAVNKSTGRTLVFEGDLKASFFPSLALQAGRLRLEDAPGFGQEPFVAVEGATFSLALAPLLHGEARVEEVTLHGVTVKLVRASDGETNWEAGLLEPAREGVEPLKAPEPEQTPTPRQDSKESSGYKGLNLQIDSVRCNDISVIYRDMRAGASYVLRVAELGLDNVRRDADIPINLAGSADDETSGVEVKLALTAQLRVESTNNAGLNVKSLAITARNRDGKSLALSLAGSARYNARGHILDVENLKGALAGTTYEAGFTVLLPGAEGMAPGVNHDVRGSIRLGKTDLDALLSVLRSFGSKTPGRAADGPVIEAIDAPVAPEAGARAGEAPKTPQDSETSGHDAPGLYADVQIAAESLTVARLPMRDITVRLVADKGTITAAPFSLKLFDGSIDGNADCDLRAEPPAVHAAAEARGVSVKPLLQALAGKDFASGKAALNLDVQGRGLAWADLAPTLQGKAGLTVTEGEVRGFNLIPRDLPGGIAPVPAEFAVERLSSSWTGTKGVFASRDILLLSPALKAQGQGTLNLPRNSTSLHLDFLVGGLPPAIPLKIEGPFASLKYTVDMEALVRNAAKDVLQSPEKAGELLKRAPGKAGSVIKDVKGLFR